ncbi:MAG TPA: choice-of-anchor tandem repeat GloVer-containing protein [Verrucomicrobiae bacterium]|nr:choice-of-anchor tandem repeat GloVer-containing protein [Verrucomicrobiae bacterium]
MLKLMAVCGSLLLASDGNFYGTTRSGTNDDYGSIFRMTPGGALTTLVRFNGRNGQYPHGNLLQARDGFIYGRTIAGGLSDHGTVFRLTTNGAFAAIFHFDGINGAGPWAPPVLGLDGDIYGTASDGPGNGGVAFRLVPPPRITKLTQSNEVVAVTWYSFTNGVYQLKLSTDLNATPWVPVGTQILGKADAPTQVTANLAKGQSFHRMALLSWLR